MNINGITLKLKLIFPQQVAQYTPPTHPDFALLQTSLHRLRRFMDQLNEEVSDTIHALNQDRHVHLKHEEFSFYIIHNNICILFFIMRHFTRWLNCIKKEDLVTPCWVYINNIDYSKYNYPVIFSLILLELNTSNICLHAILALKITAVELQLFLLWESTKCQTFLIQSFGVILFIIFFTFTQLFLFVLYFMAHTFWTVHTLTLVFMTLSRSRLYSASLTLSVR